jgi:multisubunit Na+/H+ antiporter MnhE subunit
MGSQIFLAVVIGIIWMLITSRLTLESFAVGFVIGLALTLLRPAQFTVKWRRIPRQLLALVIYLSILSRDIVLSGLDVARRVLSSDMRLKPGIITVPTGDDTRSPLITALSADVITLTPGELVVEVREGTLLYVHCLDIDASLRHATAQQAQRLRLFQQILGRSS